MPVAGTLGVDDTCRMVQNGRGGTMEYIQLNDGNKIPAIGFGVFMIPNDGPTYEAVLEALKAG